MTTKPAKINQDALRAALKPCPFCGGEAAICNSDDKLFYVTCLSLDCYCCVGEAYDRDAMPDHAFDSEEGAILAWNHRAALPQEGAAGVAEPVAWNRDRVCRAAEAANAKFGQWMPQRWIDLFMRAYEGGK